MATAPNGYHNNNGILVRPSTKHKSVLEAYLLVIPLGLIGAHHFYLRRPFFGLLYFFTFGLLGVGVIFDLFRLPWLVKDANNRIENPQLEDKRRTDDAYLLWFVFGLLGFQHFYLKRPSLGFLYLFTFGIFGFGWLRDICFLPSDVKNANNEKKDESTETKSTLMTYAFSLWFTGILGGHHFYLRRYFFGFVYFFTFGLAGVGYLADIIRVPILVMRKNKEITTGSRPKKTLDDAYLLWFPLGILGLHHFYLNRPVWGLVYFFTFGLFGLGWLVDLFRIPFLLKTCNSEIDHSSTLSYLPLETVLLIQATSFLRRTQLCTVSIHLLTKTYFFFSMCF
ncbi:hypothetical protein FSP39_003756 [Pinctada imbricata]|uniref:TM2 domain-containing protein n=1 Tax=Pinctada imbricata TaxID=66713 RepID=A0AA88XYU3_PINIB|nr:hypothetical protein FSP39_003756 [Pinctada imbricata]